VEDLFFDDETQIDAVTLIEECSSPVGPSSFIRTVRITAPLLATGVAAEKSPTVVTASSQRTCQ
jgi:hypothetical protein